MAGLAGAEELLRGGNTHEALVQLTEAVRREPAKSEHRVFLFQLLAVLGEWDRALAQLNAVGELDASALGMALVYRPVLASESLRREIFAGERSPLVFGEPEQWIAETIQALRLDAAGKHAEAEQLQQHALNNAPATPGVIDGKDFEWIADADCRMGPMLEAIVEGRYYWVPFQRIREIRLEKPTALRDLVWMPAQFVWTNGGQAVGFIPTRYAGSETSDDGQIQMARKTVWLKWGSDSYIGHGQRMLATDADDFPLLDIRHVMFNASGASS